MGLHTGGPEKGRTPGGSGEPQHRLADAHGLGLAATNPEIDGPPGLGDDGDPWMAAHGDPEPGITSIVQHNGCGLDRSRIELQRVVGAEGIGVGQRRADGSW